MRVGTSVPDPLILIRVQIRGSVSQNYKSGRRRLIYYGSNVSETVVGAYAIYPLQADQALGLTIVGSTENFFNSHLKSCFFQEININVFCPLCVFLHRKISSKREWYRQPLFLRSFRLDFLKWRGDCLSCWGRGQCWRRGYHWTRQRLTGSFSSSLGKWHQAHNSKYMHFYLF